LDGLFLLIKENLKISILNKVLHILYNISIFCYGLLLRFASLFHPKANLWVKGRKNWKSNLPAKPSAPVYWFHCASLGEFDQGLPVMNRLKELQPDIFLLVTFFSPSGYENFHKRKHLADYVCYLPLDTPSNAKFFVNYFKPEKAFFVKYEFWTNYLFALRLSRSKIYSISAIFRKNQRFFKWNGAWFRKTLRCFDHLFVQDKASGALLTKVKITNFSVCGDTRFDSVWESKVKAKENDYIQKFLNGEKAWVIGSSWPKDEEKLFEVINTKNFTKKVILAPHDIKEKNIQSIEMSLLKSFVRYTDLERGIDHDSEDQVLILNTIGHLTSAYQYGDVAYVGGGFTGKLHNILEPAIFGLPVIFGPKHARFPEANLFIDSNIGFEITESEQLLHLLEQEALYQENVKVRVEEVMKNQRGATDRILKGLQ
jgi:3-deoxy-D-manno-octulosonic-acid transferase